VTISAGAGGIVNSCPVCGYPDLRRPPRNFTICPSCGTEFDYDDFGMSEAEVNQRHLELRNEWAAAGACWSSRVVPAPSGWSGLRQLLAAGLPIRLREGVKVIPPFGPAKPHVIIPAHRLVKMTEKRARVVAYA
jgi:hypothetical protein